jgi:hypothetical protein
MRRSPARKLLSRAWKSAVDERPFDLRVHVRERAPFDERPSGVGADAREALLGEDHVGVRGAITIARAVTDEDDDAAGGLMEANAFALARATNETSRVTERKGHPLATVGDAVRVRGDKHVGHADGGQVRSDVEAEAVTDDLDLRAARLDSGDKPGEGFIVGHSRCLAPQQLTVARQYVHVPLHQLTRADLARVVQRVKSLELGAVVVVAAQQLVADVDARDRSVVIDEE